MRSWIFCMVLLSGFRDASSQVYLTKEAALETYFSGLRVERRTVFLTESQTGTIQKAAKAHVPSRIITYYVARNSEGTRGYAFFDTHIVRTMPATVMIVLNPDSTVRAVEVLAFYEPEDYRPPKRWLDLFEGKSLESDLWLKRGIHNIIGATLSAQSITDAVRVTLAVFRTAVPKEQ
ncbi:MAG: FMN-binding protein [Ignavibacteriales bacterium]|nr:FMN-binding protein [Ignavibacteriales bacterium]